MSAAEAAGYAMATYSMAADEPEEELPQTVLLALPAPPGLALPAPPGSVPTARNIEDSLSAQALVWGSWLRDWLIGHFPGRAAA